LLILSLILFGLSFLDPFMRLTLCFLLLFLAFFASSASAQTFSINPASTDPARAVGADIQALSLADFNGDGRLDMYTPGFLFKQEVDGSFTNVLKLAGIDYEGEAPKGGVFGDANFDGLLDLIIMDSEPGSRVFLNRTGGIFELGNITTNLQLVYSPIGGFWRDLNGDGWLDFAAAYSTGSHALLTGFANGRYLEQGSTYFLRTNAPNCGLAPGDYDNDGDVDVYGLGCSSANSLLNYSGGGFRPRFNDAATFAGVASRKNSASARWFDYDNDGWLDLIVANNLQELSPSENILYHNERNGRFTDVAAAAGVIGGWDQTNSPIELADFDNDGWIDFYLPAAGIGKLYKNKGNGTFEEIFGAATGLVRTPVAIAAGDFNNDGWMDLAMPGTGILFNDGGSNNWITFEAKEDIQNRFGIGAKLKITASMGVQTRVIEAGNGSLGHGDGIKAHFGVGADTVVERLEIQWPGGVIDRIDNLAVNKHYVVVKGIGINQPPSSFEQTLPVAAGYVPVNADSVRFEWEPSVDLDTITYTLSVSGRGISLSIPNLTSPRFSLSTVILPQNQVYQWSVRASDGHTVRYSGEERIFTFGQAGSSVSTIVQPVAFNYQLPNVSDGVARFVDFDMDGDLDLLYGGQGVENGILQLYRTDNVSIPLPGDGGGSYQFKTLKLSPAYIEAVSYPKITWGQLVGDNAPELIVSGISSIDKTPKTTVYLNTDNDVAVLVSPTLPQVWGGDIELGDMDGDGDLDLFITGAQNTTSPFTTVSGIYLNPGDGTFVDSNIDIPGFLFGDAAWGDMDGDGDLDLAMTGDKGDGELFSAIYRNDGSSFTDINVNLPPLLKGTVSWADFDLDGDLDLFLTGGKLGPEIFHGHSALYVNDNGFFTQHPFPFDGILSGEAAWGDYDSDGDPDIFLAGSTKPYGLPVARLYRNVNGQFAAELDLEGISNASVAFGDYNGDGDFDIITVGKDKDGEIRVSFLINQQIPELIPGR